jgi:uncharacterized membrane protein
MKAKEKMLRLNFKLLLVLFFVFISASNVYSYEYFYIKDYQTDVYIQKNSLVDIKETIKVHFNTPRHGIYRDIPFRYHIEKNTLKDIASRPVSLRDTYTIDIFNIKTPGFKHKIFKRGDYLRIRIGSSNKRVNGDVTYIIQYSLYGAVNFFSDHSEFYYNIIGRLWPVPIEHTSFEISLPEDVDENDIKYAVFSGYFGSKHKESSVSYSDGILSCEIEHPLKPRQAVSVVLYMPKGYLENGTLGLKLKLLILNNKAFIVPVLVFFFLLLVWMFVGKDEKETIMTYYKPPNSVTPAEAGMLIDDKIDNRDLISLIFYWASNGYMEIEEAENKIRLFRHQDYILRKLKDLPDDAKDFEKIIFYGLFPGAASVIRVSALKDKFYTTMKEAKDSLSAYIKDKDVYEKGTRAFSKTLITLSIIIFTVGSMLSIGSYENLAAVILTAAIIFIFGRIMPKKTKRGLKEYSAVKGFKEFMDRVEKDRLKQLLEEEPAYFYNTLSYAIAFGDYKKWANKFNDLVTEPPQWYRGSSLTAGRFSTYTFMHSINSSMASMNSAFASAPSSAGSGASGFGGGGFSGGGMGGGGGGSW